MLLKNTVMNTRDLIIDSIAGMTADEIEDLNEQLQKAYSEKRREVIKKNITEAKQLAANEKLFRGNDISEIMQWLSSND